MMKERLKANAVPIQLPIGKEENYQGIVDLVEMKAYYYRDDLGRVIEEEDIPEDMKDLADEYYNKLVEAVADQDEKLMEKYVEGENFTKEELMNGIRKATINVDIIPVTCGSSYKNKGVQKLLDCIVAYLPSPLDVPPVRGFISDDADEHEEIERHPDDNAPFSALAFKITTDPYVGKLAYFRVYSGTLNAGSYVLNSTKGRRERIGRILLMHANHREEVQAVYAGDIAATVGLKFTTTGDTLCDENHPIILESMEFPEPVINVAIEPKTKAGQDKMAIALQKMAEEDPTFRVSTNHETGQTIISGMGELHLEIIVDRMLREFKVEANIGKPQVVYKETIRKPVRAEGRFIRQTGGHGQYGHCWIEVEPLPPGSGYEFESAIVGGVIPKEYIPAIDAGVRDAMNTGVIAGYQVIDVKVRLVDGSYHEVDSSEIAFKVAGSIAFKEAMKKADPVLLEPIMKVEVTTPEEYLGDIIADLNSRRGHIEGMEARLGAQVISAFVPLSEMFGYATELRSRSQGRAVYSMQFDHYSEVPRSIQDRISSGITTDSWELH